MEIDLELGKWLLDISKYLVTAMLLATAFGDMGNPWVVMGAIATAAITLGLGLFLIKGNKKAASSQSRSNNKTNKKR